MDRTPGVLSPDGGFNHPAAPYCRETGVRLGANRTLRLVAGRRLTIAVMVDDAGRSIPIRRPLLIGREATLSPEALAGDADIVDLHDDAVSRRHAIVDLDGWALRLYDLSSQNGTWVHEAGVWRRLAPGVGIRLQEGSRFGICATVFTIHSLVKAMT